MSFYIMVKAFFKYAPLKLTKKSGGKCNNRRNDKIAKNIRSTKTITYLNPMDYFTSSTC